MMKRLFFLQRLLVLSLWWREHGGGGMPRVAATAASLTALRRQRHPATTLDFQKFPQEFRTNPFSTQEDPMVQHQSSHQRRRRSREATSEQTIVNTIPRNNENSIEVSEDDNNEYKMTTTTPLAAASTTSTTTTTTTNRRLQRPPQQTSSAVPGDRLVKYSGSYTITSDACTGWLPEFTISCQGTGTIALLSIRDTQLQPIDHLVSCTNDNNYDQQLSCTIPSWTDQLVDTAVLSLGLVVEFTCAGSHEPDVRGALASTVDQSLTCKTAVVARAASVSVALHAFRWDQEQFQTIQQQQQDSTTTTTTASPCTAGTFDQVSACFDTHICDDDAAATCPLALAAVHIQQPATDPAVIATQPCTLCYDGGLFDNSDSSECLAQNALVPAMGWTRDSSECSVVQAEAYSRCGCTTLPPPQTPPVCSLCPRMVVDAASGTTVETLPRNTGRTVDLGDDMERYQPHTCESLYVWASFTLPRDENDVDLFTNCDELQSLHALGCGCPSPSGDDAADTTTVGAPTTTAASATPSSSTEVSSTTPSPFLFTPGTAPPPPTQAPVISTRPPPVTCGNGQLDVDEVCDGTEFALSCGDLGFLNRGQQECLDHCRAVDSMGCHKHLIPPENSLSAAAGEEIRGSVTIDYPVTYIKFQIWGGTGDADLYVRKGAEPDMSDGPKDFQCRPFILGNNEVCSSIDPDDDLPATMGTYYYVIHANRAFQNMTFQIVSDGDAPPLPTATPSFAPTATPTVPAPTESPVLPPTPAPTPVPTQLVVAPPAPSNNRRVGLIFFLVMLILAICGCCCWCAARRHHKRHQEEQEQQRQQALDKLDDGERESEETFEDEHHDDDYYYDDEGPYHDDDDYYDDDRDVPYDEDHLDPVDEEVDNHAENDEGGYHDLEQLALVSFADPTVPPVEETRMVLYEGSDDKLEPSPAEENQLVLYQGSDEESEPPTPWGERELALYQGSDDEDDDEQEEEPKLFNSELDNVQV